MAVFMETSAGDIVVDLYVKEAPLASKNFLKLCKIKYYNGHLFYNVQQNFMVQAGDPTGTGRGGTSVYGLMYGEQAKYFEDEIHPTLKHDRSGLLCMANHGPNTNGSQFFFTTRGDDLDHLDGKNTIFGNVAEGMEVLMKINEQFVDDNGRPFRDMRILHTAILDDPFDDPPQLEVPENSPERDRPEEEDLVPRLGLDEDPDAGREGLDEEELELMEKRREAQSRAVVLEMIGDLPDAEMAPPDNALFVCKLNPATRDDDLELIFSRFGPVADCSIIRDHLTGDSLNYAFVEFEKEEDCEQAYYKMNNVLIDDRRIKVDFSQSVSKLWNNFNNRKRAGPKGGQSSKGDHDKKYNANYVPVGNQNEGMGTRQRERSPAAVPPNIKREGRGECRNQETQRRDNSRDRRQQQAKRDDRGEYHNNNNQEKRRRDNSGDRRRQAREEQQSMKADDGGKERPTRDRKYDDRTSLSSGGKKRRSRSRSRDRRHSSRSDTKREREEKKSSRKKDEQGSRRRRDEDHHHKRYKAEERRQEEHHGKHDRRRR